MITSSLFLVNCTGYPSKQACLRSPQSPVVPYSRSDENINHHTWRIWPIVQASMDTPAATYGADVINSGWPSFVRTSSCQDLEQCGLALTTRATEALKWFKRQTKTIIQRSFLQVLGQLVYFFGCYVIRWFIANGRLFSRTTCRPVLTAGPLSVGWEASLSIQKSSPLLSSNQWNITEVHFKCNWNSSWWWAIANGLCKKFKILQWPDWSFQDRFSAVCFSNDFRSLLHCRL